MHLAAQAGVRYSITHPEAYVQSNLVGFANILEACRHGAVEHLIYASSSSVYGDRVDPPFSESHCTDSPVSLYAATKKANEVMAHAYNHLYGQRATGLRFFTVYGPWGRPDMAYFSFAEKILAGQPLPVFGGGTLQRDFTYIDDIVEGVVRLVLSPVASGAPSYEVFNIGNHQPVSVLRFIETLAALLGIEPVLEMLPPQPGDVTMTCADVAKLRARVGFEPSTSLDEGLRRFVLWFRQWKGLPQSLSLWRCTILRKGIGQRRTHSDIVVCRGEERARSSKASIETDTWFNRATRSCGTRVGSVVSAVGQQLLVELLAGPQAAELDRDLVCRLPARRISCRARSTMRTGSPMSSTSTCPLSPIAAACSTSRAASGIVMK